MKALQMQAPGAASEMKLVDLPLPEVREGEALVEIKASSVNPIDTKVRGMPLPFSPNFPAVLQLDFAGVHEGERVYGLAGGIKGLDGGALAEFQAVDRRLMAPMPKSLSFKEAAALPLVSISAWIALVDKLKVGPGTKILIHAGLGGVGHIATQLAKHLGAHVTTTVSSEEAKAKSLSLGADCAINYKEEEIPSGFDAVFETVGGPNLQVSFRVVKESGQIASIATGGSHDLNLMYQKGISLHSVLMLLPLMSGQGREHFKYILEEIAKLVDRGVIKPLIHPEVFSLETAHLAHLLVEERRAAGKVVVVLE